MLFHIFYIIGYLELQYNEHIQNRVKMFLNVIIIEKIKIFSTMLINEGAVLTKFSSLEKIKTKRAI